MDAPAGATQEEGHAVFLHLPSAVLALIFYRDKDLATSLSLVDREIEFFVPTNKSISTCWALLFYFLFFCEENPSSCDDSEIRTHVPTSEGFEVTN